MFGSWHLMVVGALALGAIVLGFMLTPWAPIYALLIAGAIAFVVLMGRLFSSPQGMYGERDPDQEGETPDRDREGGPTGPVQKPTPEQSRAH